MKRGSGLIKTVLILGAFGFGSCSLTPRIIPYEQYNKNSPLLKESYEQIDSTKYRENIRNFYKNLESERDSLKKEMKKTSPPKPPRKRYILKYTD